jgi:radical SAM superfamily enzyme YgiQ (UPF0313 family)
MMHQGRIANILLLYPETPGDTYWSFSRCLGMIGKKAGTPPLGLLTVAGMLPASEFAVRLVDMNVGELPDEDIEWADAVFVSAMIAQKSSMEAVLRRLKTFGKTTVAGGPYPSSTYKQLENVDAFVIGEAEGVWERFLADLHNGRLRPAYASPVRPKEADELRAHFGADAHIAQATSHPDVNLAPLPRFDLLEIDKYACMTVQASRGCPVGCEFCDIWRRYGRKTRIKTWQRILAEMNALYSLGWRDSVFLVDDNFIGNRSSAREVLANLAAWQKERKWPFSFLTETTLLLADDSEMLDLMIEAGFSSVFVGIETPFEASLRETGKHINLSGTISGKVECIQSRGIQLMSGFIIGFDVDPDDIADRMTACIQELGIPQAMIGLLNALPDTDLHDRLEKEGRISGQTTGNNTHAFAMNFRPSRPVADVLRDYKLVLERAYPVDMKAYFQRCAVLRERWPEKRIKRPGFPLGWKLKVFAKYLLAAAASPYRFNALGFLLRTLLTKSSFLEQAIELGIKGHHHWAITRQAFEVDAMRTRLASHLASIAAHVRDKFESLDAMFDGLVDRPLVSGEFALEGLPALLNALAASSGATEEVAKMHARIDGVVAEIAQYGKCIRKQAEREYRRLSQSARAILIEDMEGFFREANRRCVLAPISY